jgi:hypothetical protein
MGGLNALVQNVKRSFQKFKLPPPPSLEMCRTPEEILDYAFSIQRADPGFATDLIAAVQRHRTR